MYTAYEWVMAAAAGILLVPCAIMDLKTHEIPLRFVCGMLLLAMTITGAEAMLGGKSAAEWFLSFLPGGILLVVAVLSRGRIGAGDGLVFLVIGLLLGFWDAVLLLFFSLFLSGVWGGFLILSRKGGRNTEIAWMPFVLAGYALWILAAVVPQIRALC